MAITLAELIELRKALPPIPLDAARASLSDRFLVPPFSVLDARQGYWQKRKKMWLALGIQSELGRGENLQGLSDSNDEYRYNKNEFLAKIGRGPLVKNNGLLGFSEQARSHNATPGGSPLPAETLKDGKTQRGDGRGRPLATTFGSGGPGDLAEGFRAKGAHPIPGGDTGKNSAYMFKTADGYKSLKDIQTEERSQVQPTGTTAIATQGRVNKKILEGDIEGGMASAQSGTSIFDPVLCEIAYRWFCPQAGRVLDPFAGGSVRGIVAAKLGRTYAGVDLRPEQAEANYAQMEALCPDADLTWAVGDSQGITDLLPGGYDLVFSCPPYADLERYSDDPRDLSTMDYDKFLEVYRAIIASSCAMLKDNRFACFVVGDIRDRVTGNYRGFVNDTISAFRAAGLELYNEAVLVTAVGSLPIRVGRQFAGCRKLGKTHQNVLVFVKGDPVLATDACGQVDVDDLSMPEPIDRSIALCRQDVVGTMAEQYLMDSGELDASNLYLPLMESYLLVDVLRSQLRAEGKPTPRVWLGTPEGWSRIDDGSELTYLVGGSPYLSRNLFPDAKGPTDTPPVPRRLR